MSTLRNWVALCIGIIFIATTAYNSLMFNFELYECEFNDKDIFMVVLNPCIIAPLIIYNVYHLCKLYGCIYRSSDDKSSDLLKPYKSFAKLSTVFIASWSICYIQGTYLFIWRLECGVTGFMDLAFLPPPAFFGIYTFTIIGIECSNLRQFITAQSANLSILDKGIICESGSPFILFNLKWYSLGLAGLSAAGLAFCVIWYLPWEQQDSWWWGDIPETEYDHESYSWTMFIMYSMTSILGVILWFQCHSYPQKLLLYQNTLLQKQDNRVSEEYENNLSEERPVIKMANGTSMRNLKLLYSWYLSFWKKYKFWNQNITIIITSTITIIGATTHYLNTKTFEADMQLLAVGVTCGFIIFVSISSMIIHKFQCCCCLAFTSTDNKFRFLCVVKTTLLLIKQILIHQIASDLWQWMFRILSIVSLISIATITYAFDHQFIQTLDNNMKHAKLFYITYGVSYFITNISTAIIVISSINNDPSDDILALIIPFIFLYFTKLYNNEYSRYKEDMKRKFNGDVDTKQLSTTIRSLYYFQRVVVMMSLTTFVVMIVVNDKGSSLDDTVRMKYTADFVIQMIFAVIIFLNGIIVLYILNDEENETEYMENVMEMYYVKMDS